MICKAGILDPGSWTLRTRHSILHPGHSILDMGSRDLDLDPRCPGSWIRVRVPGSQIQDPGPRILDQESWIPDIQDPLMRRICVLKGGSANGLHMLACASLPPALRSSNVSFLIVLASTGHHSTPEL